MKTAGCAVLSPSGLLFFVLRDVRGELDNSETGPYEKTRHSRISGGPYRKEQKTKIVRKINMFFLLWFKIISSSDKIKGEKIFFTKEINTVRFSEMSSVSDKTGFSFENTQK